MKLSLIFTLITLTLNVQASTLFGMIKKIEVQLSKSYSDSALEDIQSLENGLKVEGSYKDYSEIVDSLKAVAYFQKADFSNSLKHANNAIKTMDTRENGDAIVSKYYDKISKLHSNIEQAFPFASLEKYAGIENNFLYNEFRHDTLYKKYDSYFTINHDNSSSCILDITKNKINYSYTPDQGHLKKASHYWKFNYKIDFSKVRYLKRFKYTNTNNIRFIRFSYDEDAKETSKGIYRKRYKMNAKNDAIIKNTESSESYIDIEIGNNSTEDYIIDEIESSFLSKYEKCKSFSRVSPSTYKETLAKINKITNKKLSHIFNTQKFSTHNIISYTPYKNKCGGTFQIKQIQRFHKSKETSHQIYQTEITDPSAMVVNFDRQRFYRNGKKNDYNRDGVAVEWVFYGWIENGLSKFQPKEMYSISDNGKRSKIGFNLTDSRSQQISNMTDPGYYQVRDLLKKFFKQISCI